MLADAPFAMKSSADVMEPTSLADCFTIDLPEPTTATAIFRRYRKNAAYQLIVSYRLFRYTQGNWLLNRVASRMMALARQRSGGYINPNASIGPRLQLPHTSGVVIGHGVKIGADVTIFQQVTLGAKRLGEGRKDDVYPQVGDHVVIYAGAKVVGPVKLGDRCQVGCNAVVLNDIPPGRVAVGIPAKLL